MTDTESRQHVITEARSWIGTPYNINQCVKGVGVDCARLLVGVYAACELIPAEDLGIFSDDWFCNISEDVYMRRVLRHARKILESVCYRNLAAIGPGDIVLTKAAHSKVFNHGAIVVKWPTVIHAIQPVVQEIDVTQSPLWAVRDITVFTLWGDRAR